MELSVVVPAYNESARIKPFLTDLEKLNKNSRNMEIVLVDDGSKDGTLGILRDFGKRNKNTRVITYSENSGKGYAVRKGVMESKGDKIIFIDADGSIKPNEIPKMSQMLDNFDVVVGDRTHMESDVDQPILRKMTGKSFNFYASSLFGINVRDNLCGFKGFRRKAARDIFGNLLSNRWVFDVEVFYRAKKGRYSMAQMSIEWVHKDGTKIKVFDPVKMFLELAVLRVKISRST